MPKKTSTERVKAFRNRQRGNRPASTRTPNQAPKSARERMREYRARKKALRIAAAMGPLSQVSPIPTDADTQRSRETSSHANIDCSKRWVYVRDYYIRRKGKRQIMSACEAVRKRSQQLSFLDDVPSSKKSTLTNTDYCESENIDDFTFDTYDSIKNDDIKRKKVHENEILIINEQDVFNESKFCSNNSQADTEHKVIKKWSNKRKFITSESVQSNERLKILKQIAKKQNRGTCLRKREDENDLFFASMAEIVKKLPKLTQAKLRMQIGNLVGHEEIAYLSINAESSPPYSNNLESTSVNTYYAENVFSAPAENQYNTSDTKPFFATEPSITLKTE